MTKTPTHGGRRLGSGRPHRFGEPMALIRVPESIKPALIDELSRYRLRKEEAQLELVPAACNPPVRFIDGFLTRVSAGFPSPADDYLEEGIDLNQLLVRNAPATFFYVVEPNADSMNLAGIHGGDRIMVDRSIDPKSGHIVLALIAGEGATVKELKIRGKAVSLVPHSSNPEHKTRILKEGEEVSIIGVVTTAIRQFRT